MIKYLKLIEHLDNINNYKIIIKNYLHFLSFLTFLGI
jgi:hypothetical protein